MLGDYRLLRRIGRGGMGSVYTAIHPRLGHRVAVKVLHQHLLGRDTSMQRRFEREARLAARLSSASPHLVRVHDVDFDATAGCHYLVMEYVEGVTAEEWAHSTVSESGATSELDVLDVCHAATLGLVAAHRRGVVHRDVKPSNILIPVTEIGASLKDAKLADLGLARPEHVKEGLTAAGQVMLGTAGYAAGEQLEHGTTARKASDVFAMGATIYKLLCGEAPFVGKTPMARAVETIKGNRVPLRDLRPSVSDAVDALVDTCLQRDPDQRFPDASALAEALRLCRRAVVGSEPMAHEIPSRVMQLVGRDEDGKSALSTFATRVFARSSRVLFDSGPPGARVTLTPTDTEGDPLEYTLDEHGRRELLDVPVGTYELLARQDDHEDLRARLSVRAGVDLNFPLQMRERSGFLVVASEPAGAEVVVDGVRLGKTPIRRFQLPAGSHEVIVTLEGHCHVVREVSVRGGSAVDLGVLALERCATLDVSEQPGDVRFALDGEPVDDGALVDPGVRRLTASRAGYESQALTLSVEAGAVLRPSLPKWRLNARALIGSREIWRSAGDSDRRRAARALADGRGDLELVELEDVTCGELSESVAVFRHVPTGLDLVLVPGDAFAMGSPPDEPGRRSDERRHDVALAPFLVARAPVTRATWAAVMEKDAPPPAAREHPAEVQGWTHAAEFCHRAGLLLPTEAQWEHACRGGSTAAFAWGDDAEEAPRYADIDGGWNAPSRPVAERAPNAFGLFDVHGGVWEWCRDRYGEYPFDAVVDPDGARSGAYRVLRGGSRFDAPALARAAYRAAAPPEGGVVPAGLRPVAELHLDDALAPIESSVAGVERDDA